MARAMYVIRYNVGSFDGPSHMVTRKLSKVATVAGSEAYKWARAFFTRKDLSRNTVTRWAIPGCEVFRIPNVKSHIIARRTGQASLGFFHPDSGEKGIMMVHSDVPYDLRGVISEE